MSTPAAVLAGSIIIGLAITGTRLIAPYQIASGTAVVWRVNTVTGDTVLCNSVIIVGDEAAKTNCCH